MAASWKMSRPSSSTCTGLMASVSYEKRAPKWSRASFDATPPAHGSSAASNSPMRSSKCSSASAGSPAASMSIVHPSLMARSVWRGVRLPAHWRCQWLLAAQERLAARARVHSRHRRPPLVEPFVGERDTHRFVAAPLRTTVDDDRFPARFFHVVDAHLHLRTREIITDECAADVVHVTVVGRASVVFTSGIFLRVATSLPGARSTP